MATILENNNQSSIGAQECAESSRKANTMPMRTFSEVKGLLFVREHQHRLASKREVLLHRTMLTACPSLTSNNKSPSNNIVRISIQSTMQERIIDLQM